MSFALARPLLTVRFKTFFSHLAFKPAEVEIIRKTLGIEDGKEPVGSVQTTQKAVRRRSVAQRTCVAARICVSSQHSRCFNYRTRPSSRSSCRGRAGGRSQYIATCSGRDHLDPTDRLEVEPPDADQQELWRANYAARRLGVYDGTACLRSATNLTQTSPDTRHVGDAGRRRSVAKLLTHLPTAR